jgi:hypothetical protein
MLAVMSAPANMTCTEAGQLVVGMKSMDSRLVWNGNSFRMGARHILPFLAVHLRDDAFRTTDDGKPVGAPIKTLEELVAALAKCQPKVLDGRARRGDFSRWIADVFHDHPLGLELQKVEQRYRLGWVHDLPGALAKPIQEHFELSLERA